MIIEIRAAASRNPGEVRSRLILAFDLVFDMDFDMDVTEYAGHGGKVSLNRILSANVGGVNIPNGMGAIPFEGAWAIR